MLLVQREDLLLEQLVNLLPPDPGHGPAGARGPGRHGRRGRVGGRTSNSPKSDVYWCSG